MTIIGVNQPVLDRLVELSYNVIVPAFNSNNIASAAKDVFFSINDKKLTEKGVLCNTAFASKHFISQLKKSDSYIAVSTGESWANLSFGVHGKTAKEQTKFWKSFQSYTNFAKEMQTLSKLLLESIGSTSMLSEIPRLEDDEYFKKVEMLVTFNLNLASLIQALEHVPRTRLDKTKKIVDIVCAVANLGRLAAEEVKQPEVALCLGTAAAWLGMIRFFAFKK